ncbi:large-conductance mechanosensitive channel protein MscL [Candidatus Stoquefichus massiliensis]|uniref:large-conductance mechanosensitive channel protein MscL n=1 Tax=Candidatus Stoquefichus massiliensis TaxID=1470350 RepID=UPI0004831039|nr:large-conductance mechanosensitive channel protein MscL [Candidatus Stoquefichus massiliensis]
MKKFITEFKEFAMRGNVLDMAVGVIIGGAFGKIVSSLVNDMIMPIITLITGAADFSKLSLVLKEPIMENEKVISEGISLMYGSFLQNVIDFLIIALVIFMMLKFVMKLSSLRQKQEEEIVEEKGPSTEELLIEIRDLLKENKN